MQLFKLLIFVDQNYYELFLPEFQAVFDSFKMRIEDFTDNIFLLRNVSVIELEKIMTLGTVRSLGLVIDIDHLEQSLEFFFQTFTSKYGYYIQNTYYIRDFKKWPKRLLSKFLSALKNNIPNAKVSLRYPQLVFNYLPSFGTIYLELPVARDIFLHRDPQYRPFAPPASLPAILTRVLINLSSLKKEYMFLDPFCGTGTIALDAASLGAISICVDLNKDVLLGAQLLSKFYGLEIKIFQGDARNLLFLEDNSIDSIATDPPYGIGSPTFGVSTRRLYYDFLSEANRVLKSHRRVVLCHTNSIPIRKYAEILGFELLYQFSMKIHSGLTRLISVLYR